MQSSLFIVSQPLLKSNFILSKVQKYRQHIRREQKQKKFSQIRNGIQQSYRDKQFLQFIQENKGQLMSNSLQMVANGLSNGKSSAQFIIKIADLHLQQNLIQLISFQAPLCLRLKMIQFLVGLTYYSKSSSLALANERLAEFLISQLKSLTIKQPIQMEYLIKIVCLVENITSNFELDFNYFIMQSSFCQILRTKILKAQQSQFIPSLTHQLLRESAKLYCNLVNQINLQKESCKKNLMFMFSNQMFMDCAFKEVLKCIRTIGENQNDSILTELICNEHEFASTIQEITDRVEKCKDLQVIDLYIKLMISFLENGLRQAFSLIKETGMNFYIQYLLKVHENPCCNSIKTILKFFLILLKQSVEIEPRYIKSLIVVAGNKKHFQNLVYGQLSARLFIAILKLDDRHIQDIMGQSTTDSLQFLLNNTVNNPAIIQSLRLILILIESQQQLNRQKYNAIIKLFYCRGIVDIIGKLQDHSETQIATFAEKVLRIIQAFEIEQPSQRQI